jgi:polyprenyl-phospho-N-acetylgalactosaminyl synthase
VALDCIIPARNEEPTVAAVVESCRACAYAREVIVVDDGSTDATAEVAAAAGAKVVPRLPGCDGLKALAMRIGVESSDADTLLFVDADCTGIRAAHLDAICAPVAEGRCELSIGLFDYGPFWNPLVRLAPPMSGERAMPRWVWEAIPSLQLDGYTVELRINQVIAEGGHRTVVRTMEGVSHRTKREKLGRRAGYRATLRMYRDILRLPFSGEVRWRTYSSYFRGLTVESGKGAGEAG